MKSVTTHYLSNEGFLINIANKKSSELYSAYQTILTEYCGYEIEQSEKDMSCKILKDSDKVAELDYGYEQGRYYMTVTIPNK